MAMHLLREAPVTDTQGATLLLDASHAITQAIKPQTMRAVQWLVPVS